MALAVEEGALTGSNCPQSECVKKNWFQGKCWGTSAHWMWPRLLGKHFINLLTPQPQVLCF